MFCLLSSQMFQNTGMITITPWALEYKAQSGCYALASVFEGQLKQLYQLLSFWTCLKSFQQVWIHALDSMLCFHAWCSEHFLPPVQPTAGSDVSSTKLRCNFNGFSIAKLERHCQSQCSASMHTCTENETTHQALLKTSSFLSATVTWTKSGTFSAKNLPDHRSI